MANPFVWNITSILPEMSSNLGNGSNWMLYAFGALVLGILIGGLVKGAAKLTHFDGKWAPKCPNCGNKMEFALAWKCKPPPKWNFGERISDWNCILSSGSNR